MLALDQKNITADPGQNVTLPCRAPSNNNRVVEWSKADPDPQCVLLYRDEQYDPEHQHPSFVSRVDLKDRQMKDGDVSLILKNVTTADSGTYECRVFHREVNRRRRANLKTDPISIVKLYVVPPGDAGGQEKDEKKEAGGKEDGVSRGRAGLFAALSVVIIVLAAAFICIKQKTENSPLPS